MKPIPAADRRVANIHDADYPRWEGGENPAEYLQLNPSRDPCTGFHIYRMAPGTRSDAHEHTGDEEFLVLEGELTDHDGTVYRTGDLVWLRQGTQHWSHTEGGCLLAVHIPTAERNLPNDTD